MFITSSRKPSAKTRAFCKKLSQFTTFRYVSRGKTGLRELLNLAEGEAFLTVGEYHGNPGSLGFHGPEGKLLFSFRFSDASAQGTPCSPRKLPKISGNGEPAETLASFLPFERVEDSSSLPNGSRLLFVGESMLDFREGETSVLKLRLKGFKRYEGEAGTEAAEGPVVREARTDSGTDSGTEAAEGPVVREARTDSGTDSGTEDPGTGLKDESRLSREPDEA